MERLEDRHKRAKEVDVFFHANQEAVEQLIEDGYTVNHAGASDMNPRVALPPYLVKEGDTGFADLKACSKELLAKLYVNQG